MQLGLKPPQETSRLFTLGRFNRSRSEIENKLSNKQTNNSNTSATLYTSTVHHTNNLPCNTMTTMPEQTQTVDGCVLYFR